MKTLVIYFSKFGNTQKIAETIAKNLIPLGPARAIAIEQLSSAALIDVDLVVMGSPTYRMNLPETVRATFETLPRRSLRKKSVAAFDTSYEVSAFLAHFTAAKKLAHKLSRLGGRQIASPQTFHVTGREGPLVDGEIERAAQWAVSIGEKLGDQQAKRRQD